MPGGRWLVNLWRWSSSWNIWVLVEHAYASPLLAAPTSNPSSVPPTSKHTRQLMKAAENSDNESPPLQIDPKWYAPSHFLARIVVPLTRRSLQDILRTFFQPIKTEDPRVDFYTMYKRESAEYDMDYVKKYDEDLNTTLIFVRCSS